MKFMSLVFILFFTHTIFSQQLDTISTEVKNFWKIVDENAKYEEKKSDFRKQNTNEELKEIAKKLYSATEKDPFGFARHIVIAHDRYLSDVKVDHNLRAPYIKFHMLMLEINDVFGEKYGEILETPFFIRGKILKQIDTFYYSESEKIKFGQTKLLVQIEEIIKGNKFFKKDTIIEVNFLDHWVDYSLELNNDSSYFMALRVWGDKCNKLCLRNFSPGDLEIYPITNGIIEIRKNVYGKNTFGLGEKVDWEKFLTSFREKYILEGGTK